MREVFQSQLTEVQSRLVEMAEDTARIIEKATKAFGTSDVALADEAIAISDATSNKALALDELVISRQLHVTFASWFRHFEFLLRSSAWGP
jgi:phosphate transport system protein